MNIQYCLLSYKYEGKRNSQIVAFVVVVVAAFIFNTFLVRGMILNVYIML